MVHISRTAPPSLILTNKKTWWDYCTSLSVHIYLYILIQTAPLVAAREKQANIYNCTSPTSRDTSDSQQQAPPRYHTSTILQQASLRLTSHLSTAAALHCGCPHGVLGSPKELLSQEIPTWRLQGSLLLPSPAAFQLPGYAEKSHVYALAVSLSPATNPVTRNPSSSAVFCCMSAASRRHSPATRDPAS